MARCRRQRERVGRLVDQPSISGGSRSSEVAISCGGRYWDRTSDLCRVKAERGPWNDGEIGVIPRCINGFRLSSLVLLHGRFELSDGHLNGHPSASSGIADGDEPGVWPSEGGNTPDYSGRKTATGPVAALPAPRDDSPAPSSADASRLGWAPVELPWKDPVLPAPPVELTQPEEQCNGVEADAFSHRHE